MRADGNAQGLARGSLGGLGNVVREIGSAVQYMGLGEVGLLGQGIVGLGSLSDRTGCAVEEKLQWDFAAMSSLLESLFDDRKEV